MVLINNKKDIYYAHKANKKTKYYDKMSGKYKKYLGIWEYLKNQVVEYLGPWDNSVNFKA